jgi:hypothetical protein
MEKKNALAPQTKNLHEQYDVEEQTNRQIRQD